MSKKCIGCGVPLQTELENDYGYTKSKEMDYCVRCFKLIHYGKLEEYQSTLENESTINKINKIPSHVFFLIDFLNLHEESFLFFQKIKQPKTLVVTKIDTIPKSIYLEKIRIWLEKMCHTKDIIMVDKNSKTKMEKIEEEIDQKKEKTIIFSGVTNAGKSTFLNDFLKKTSITVSYMPNTTLDFIKIPYKSTHTLYDTPGLLYHTYKMNQKMLKNVNAKEEIKPITYPVKEHESLIIEDFLRISCLKNTFITWFSSNNIKIKKVYEKNTSLLDKKKINLEIKDNSNLYIKGIGFFYLKYGTSITLYNIEENCISVLPSFF